MIDEKFGEIMNALEEQDYLKNSIVIFTSDHGDCMTDHGHSQKWTMYDLVTRVPMIVWAPDRFWGSSTDRRLGASDGYWPYDYGHRRNQETRTNGRQNIAAHAGEFSGCIILYA